MCGREAGAMRPIRSNRGQRLGVRRNRQGEIFLVARSSTTRTMPSSSWRNRRWSFPEAQSAPARWLPESPVSLRWRCCQRKNRSLHCRLRAYVETPNRSCEKCEWQRHAASITNTTIKPCTATQPVTLHGANQGCGAAQRMHLESIHEKELGLFAGNSVAFRQFCLCSISDRCLG
jgi:hypothetical protein